MSPKTHLTAGLLAAAICCQYIPGHIIEIIAGAYITSTLPDIDQKLPKIKGKKKHSIFGHRRLTHSLICPAVLFIMYNTITAYGRHIIAGMVAGWLSHIVLDLFNGKGAELFAPFSEKNYSLADLKYDGVGERVIFYLCVVGIVVIIVGVGNIKMIAGGMMK